MILMQMPLVLKAPVETEDLVVVDFGEGGMIAV